MGSLLVLFPFGNYFCSLFGSYHKAKDRTTNNNNIIPKEFTQSFYRLGAGCCCWWCVLYFLMPLSAFCEMGIEEKKPLNILDPHQNDIKKNKRKNNVWLLVV